MRDFIDEQKARLGVRSHGEFARRVGVERETVSRWYNTGQLPTPGTAQVMAAALGLEAEQIPQYDPRGVSPKVAAHLAAEVADLRAEVEALAAALRELEERAARTSRMPGKSQPRRSRAR